MHDTHPVKHISHLNGFYDLYNSSRDIYSFLNFSISDCNRYLLKMVKYYISTQNKNVTLDCSWHWSSHLKKYFCCSNVIWWLVKLNYSIFLMARGTPQFFYCVIFRLLFTGHLACKHIHVKATIWYTRTAPIWNVICFEPRMGKIVVFINTAKLDPKKEGGISYSCGYWFQLTF